MFTNLYSFTETFQQSLYALCNGIWSGEAENNTWCVKSTVPKSLQTVMERKVLCKSYNTDINQVDEAFRRSEHITQNPEQSGNVGAN